MSERRRDIGGWAFLFLLAGTATAATAGNARQEYDSGHFAQAAAAWAMIADQDRQRGDAFHQALALAQQAGAEEKVGNYPAAIDCLQKSVQLGAEHQPLLKVRLAEALILARSDSMGMSVLPDAQKLLDSVASDATLRVQVQAAYGALALARRNPGVAAQAYEASLAAALAQNDHPATAQAAASAAVAYLTLARFRADALAGGDASMSQPLAMAIHVGERLNDLAWDTACLLPPSHDAAFILLTIGQNDEGFAALASDGRRLRLAAYTAYQNAIKTADASDDIIRSYALGYTGHLYEMDGRTDEAKRLTAQALFLAQRREAPELLYLWQWQSGRLLKDGGETDGAIAAYQEALASLRQIQIDLSAGGGNSPGEVSFRQVAGNVYYELSDLLLRRAAVQGTVPLQQADLAAARDTVEKLKTAELQNYFQDRCEHLLDERRKTIETLDAHTAVVYFIPLADRVEILVSVSQPGDKSLLIHRFATPVSGDELAHVARRFRVEVRNQASEDYFADAQSLYQSLIAPIEPYLSEHGGIDTLVFVPDGALRSIPMAALVDSQGAFLIEKYAVAVSPGLRLTDARSTPRAGDPAPRILISGLSIARDGFPALKYVPEEVSRINAYYGRRGQTLLNEQFQTAQMDDQLQTTDYSIVHIASHGHFGGDARDTYVLDFDGRLDLDELERLIEPSKYRRRPVDLLTLSACETAAGDDRAALGLAGIAVKAGALSAMATLWSVNDRSSALLVPRFYAHLAEPDTTKAKALRAAQLELMRAPEFSAYRHPYFWSPYLIVGNWL